MLKLYKSAIHHSHWIASVPGAGWVMFPARAGGWEHRQPARGIDPLYLRQVPARLAVDCGFPQPEMESAA